MRQEKLEIDQQLRAIHGGNNMGSMQSFPVQRRSDRGYSSDIDSIRSNRGGAAGQSNQAGGLRGRGGRGGRNSNPRFHPGNNIHNNNDSNRPNNFDNQESVPRPKYYQRGGGDGRGGGNRPKTDERSHHSSRGASYSGPAGDKPNGAEEPDKQ